MKLHKINTDQRLYVMPCVSGFSCYGFDVLDNKARAVGAWLSLQMPTWPDFYAWKRAAHFADRMPEPGTAEHFEYCAEIMKSAADFASRTGKRCDAELCPELIGLEGRRVEATQYGERIRFKVGKSTGWLPVHLRIHNVRSTGGEAISRGSLSDVRVVR